MTVKNSYLKDGIEWKDYDLIGECDHCNQTRPVCLLSDPFISEVYPEDSEEKKSFYCMDCFVRRKDNV